MRALIAFIAILSVSVPAFAATPATGRGRASMANQMDGRVAVSKKYIGNLAAVNGGDVQKPEVEDTTKPDVPDSVKPEEEKPKDMREREKAACIQNNIGVGATFVWASKYSNTGNYSSMIEDVEFPENNVCFVKVGVKSDDARIDVSDVPTKYFVMGETIKCGAWANADTLRGRILDAKKKGRTWATVGGAVGGAGIGVGAMELFGNELIGGKVEGQAALEDEELLCSQLKVLKQEKSSKYNDIMDALRTLRDQCNDTQWANAPKSDAVKKNCEKYDYDALLKC